MTAFAVMEMYRRLRASHWPTVALPWVRWGVQMVDVGDDLVALERDQYGKVKTVVVWPQYRWDPARETLPGGELFDMLKRRDDAELAKLGAAQVQVSDDDRKKYPILVDHLTQRKWEDGSKRETSKLSVWHDGGRVQDHAPRRRQRARDLRGVPVPLQDPPDPGERPGEP